jgi:Holliday junction resolvase RusA-like endonuclease
MHTEIQTRELIVVGTPRSLQAKSRQNLQEWKRYVSDTARRDLSEDEGAIQWADVAVQILHFCPEWGDTEGDLDNIAKPILDALCDSGRVIFNDNQVKEILLRRVEWKRLEIVRIDGATQLLAEKLDRALQGDGPAEFIYIGVTTRLLLESLP